MEHVHKTFNKNPIVDYFLNVDWTLNFYLDNLNRLLSMAKITFELRLFKKVIVLGKVNYKNSGPNFGYANMDFEVVGISKISFILFYSFIQNSRKLTEIVFNFYSMKDSILSPIVIFVFFYSLKIQV